MRQNYETGLDRLIALLGEETTLVFLQKYCGRPTYIPQTLDNDMELVKTIGREAAQKLVERYGGEHMPVPMAKEWRIQQYYERGFSARKIAGLVGLGVNSIYNNFKRLKDKNQLELF